MGIEVYRLHVRPQSERAASLRRLSRCGARQVQEVGYQLREPLRLTFQLRGEEAGARDIAALIATQTVGLAYTRYILKLPPLVAMPSGTIIRVIGATIQRYLDNPLRRKD